MNRSVRGTHPEFLGKPIHFVDIEFDGAFGTTPYFFVAVPSLKKRLKNSASFGERLKRMQAWSTKVGRGVFSSSRILDIHCTAFRRLVPSGKMDDIRYLP
jgi:hypothetical protein